MCTTIRTKKLIVGLALVAVTVGCGSLYVSRITKDAQQVHEKVFDVTRMVLPVIVLIINMILVREMRRASNNAAANLGLQQHQQSQSAVPTVMLVTTSLAYVLLQGSYHVVEGLTLIGLLGSETDIWKQNWIAHEIARAMWYFVYTYNFYVYLITGRQFRADLRILFCRRSASSAAPAVAATARNRNDIRMIERGQADTAV